MNRIFRIIWSKAQCAWVVVSELATRRGKGGRSVDERVVVSDPMLDRDAIESSPPPLAWPLRLNILIALLAMYAPAHAADRWWDPNGTAIGIGGSGTWNTTSAFWSPNNDGVSGPYSAWNNGALDDAFFGGTTGTVTLGTGITVHNITFLVNGYTLTGNTLTLAGTAPTINTGNGAVTQTISSTIAGTAGLTKTGTGTLSLTGSNTFTGDVNVNAGGLSINGNAALGNTTNVVNMVAGTTLSSSGALGSSRTINLVSGIANIRGGGLGGEFYTGAGGLNVGDGIALTNNANNYQGQTQFTTLPGWSGSTNSFSSIADLGVASALGAPTTVTNGTILLGPGGGQALGASVLSYTGTGNSSNRNWQFRPGNYAGGAYLHNNGSGALTLTGDMAAVGGSQAFGFSANSADLNLLGVISSNTGRTAVFNAGSGRTIRLGTANTFSGTASIGGAGTVEAALISNAGVAGSLGTGAISIGGGNLSYVGTGESTNKSLTISNGSLNSNGTGALTVGGTVAIGGTATLGGSFTGADNIISGVISGTGSLRSAGPATWVLTGANTYTGSTIVSGGTLRAGTASAFGASTAAQVNGGTLDLNGFDKTFTTLSGTGGTVDLGSATLTLEGASGVTSSYAGNITGSGGLTKLGASTQTLTGASTYTGDTTIGGGTLRLDFSTAGGPTSNIIGSASTLVMNGGTLNVIGAAGETNTQTFDGVNITGSNNTIGATSGTGGSMTVNLGAITRTGGLVNFNLPTSGNLTTTNTALGGWATVNGTDYAKVVGGNILAFTQADYTDQDDASLWASGQFISDSDGDAQGFFSTVGSSIQLGGLQYTMPVSTTVTVAAGQTLGVDGTIIVAPSVLNTNQVINGGMMTGAAGGVLGVQQNSTGNFTINSQIVDNGGATGFTKAGTGLVTLGNTNNSYTGATEVVQGILSVGSIQNGGVNSSIGASTSDSSNLALYGSTLRYTGATTTSDRGFTIGKSGAILGSGVEVTNAAANLTFEGLVTSSDGANFTKSGAGTLTLANGSNDFNGIVTVSGGLLSTGTLANGGQVSGIGAGGSASANLVLNGGGLQYTGATTSTDRGMTLGTSGGTMDVTDAGTTLTVSGTVAGSGLTRLTKNGDGTLVLSGTNTYIGGNTVNGGILRAGSTQAFGQPDTRNVMTLANVAGVTLDLNGFDNFVGPLNGGGANGGNVTLGSATLRIGGNGGSYSGVISGTGGVWRTDGGLQTFNGCNNTYTGATTLQGAVLSVDCLADGGVASGIGASTSASSNLTFSNGNLRYTGGTVGINRGFNLLGFGVIDVTNAATTLGFSGQVVGGGELYKDGTGTLVLSGNNTYTNNTHVRGGTLRAGSNTAFGTTNSFWMDNTAGVLLDLNNFNANAGALIGGGAAGGNIALGSGTLTIRDGLGQTYAGAITGSGNLIKNGGGTQILTGCNSSYTGTTTINAGVLGVSCLNNGGSNSTIGASTAVASNLVLNGGTLRYVGTGGATDRQFTLGTSGGTIDASGTGIIQFTSTAPVTLAGANTARTFTLTGTNTGYNLFSAQLDDNGAGATSLTKSGTGTWRLTNNNSTYTGVTRITGGILAVDQMANGGVASSIGASSNAAANLVIGNGSTLRYTGTGDTTDRRFTLDSGVTFIESSGTGALVFNNTGAVTLSGTNTARTLALGGTNTGGNTFGGTIGDNGTGKTTLAKNDSGTWILTGNNTYTGNTVINNGNLMIGNGGTTGNAGAGNVIIDSPTSTLSLNRSDTFLFNGTLSGPGTLAQVGTGTSTLTLANNSVGATTISAGTLDVNGGLTTPTIAMSGTSTLSVDGTVQAAGPTQTVIVGDAGTSTINVNAGGTLLAEGDLGDGNDTVNITGTLDTGAGTLSLGGGDDTLVLNDGAQMLGTGVNSSGGGGTDTLVVNTALGFVLDGGDVDTFDILTKQNTGVLTLTGDHDFSVATDITGGVLDVVGTLTTPTVTMADGTTLNVDGTVEAAGATPATITGSAGTNTVVVNTDATLRADGDLGGGADQLLLMGTLDTGAGTLGLGAGDDLFVLNDGAVISGAGVDGASAGTGDTLLLNNAQALTFDGAQTTGFEDLVKSNVGTATMTGTQTFSNSTTIVGGTLDIDGNLTTPVVSLDDNTALNVDGTLQGGVGTPVTVQGSSGVNTVSVGAGGTLLATGDLGAGNDVLDVTGTLNTDGGIFALGDGDDSFVVHDGTNVTGTVDGGAGNDTRVYDINGTADIGAMLNFEGLTKSGIGTLNINGPGATDLQEVQVLGGTLNVGPAGSIVATAGSTLDTVVASGATLNVDGSYGCGDGNDTMSVSGTVSGSGTIDLCAGDDTLTLNDGAVLNNGISGGDGAGDTVVLNNAGALTFDAGNTSNFENLQKDNTGTATLIGSQGFTGGTTLTGGTLDVDGTLDTPTVAVGDGTTLNVDGTVRADVGTATTVSGDAGSSTVVVGSGGTLLATGDLGDGVDTLDISGTLDTGGGVFGLGDGDDNFVVHDGTNVIGTIDGGAGNDTRTYDINASADLGALVNFEGITKTGTGVLNINGPSATDVQDVQVLAGTLNVGPAGSIVATAGSTLNTNVASGATLNVDGSYGCGDGNDTMTVAGTVQGSGTIDLCAGDDTLTLNDGAVLDATISGGDGSADTVVLDNAGAMTFDGSNVSNFEILQKDNTGVATLTGEMTFSGGTVLNQGTLDVDGTLFTPTVTMADNTTLNVDGFVSGGPFFIDFAQITGSDGVNTVVVGSNGHLVASGDLGAGDDVLDVGGFLDIIGGAFALGEGTDTLVIHENTSILGGVDAGDGVDVLEANIAAGVANLDSVYNFETLEKTGDGLLQINGTGAFLDVDVQTGTVDVAPGALLSAQTTTVADGATMNVLGTFTGTDGDDSFTVAGTVMNTGTIDLGIGNDTLDVFGTLDTGSGTFNLGDGDDTFTVHDGTNVIGSIDGGVGNDTRVYDINGVADVGALLNFEGLTKTGTGTLNLNGPAATELQDVQVLGGVLNIGPDGSVVATAGSTLDTVVASGATLNVDGSFGCGDGNDTMSVSGTVSGSGTIDMCDGEDTLTLNDGAVLNTVISGGGHGTGDTVVLNNADALSFDASNTINFEYLQKDNSGIATLTGTQTFVGGTTVNGGTLDVDGTLATPTVALTDGTTLNVDGIVQGDAGTTATITGDAGTNTVLVGSGGTLLATGDLGDGNDVLDVAGTLDTQGGSVLLGDGDDTLTVHDGTDIIGTVVAGAGNDTFNADIATSADLGAVQGFETLSKTNVGELNINGPLSSDFSTVNVLGGTVNVTANGSVSAQITTVAAGATLNVEGSYTGTSGDDVLDIAGTLIATTPILLGDGEDTFTVHDGTNVIGTVDGGAGNDSRVYDINGTADVGALVNFEGLTKTGAGTLNLNGPDTTDLQEVEVLGGTLNVGPNASIVATAGTSLNTTVASGATLNVDGSFGCGDGNDTMSVSGTVSGSGTIDMCAGDDTLTLNDGAVLNTVISGGTHGSGDTVVLNNANALTFDAGNTINFEFLQKDNTGTATLTGTQTFSGGTAINGGTLDVDGTLTTPTVALTDGTTLNVDGTLQASGGTAATLSGDAGANTVAVGAGGTLLATGDLGDGNDVLDVAGTLDTQGGSVLLGDGDDTLTVHDGTNIVGTVMAGAGNDTFNADIATSADLGAVQDFETLSKTNVGELNINGPLSSDFTTVNVLGGTLNVTSGGSVSAQTTSVAAGATLNVQGSYTGTAGDDTFTSRGTVTGALSFGTGDDQVDFIGGNISGLTSLSGGDGNDRVGFSDLILDGDTLPTLGGWERVELLNGTQLTLGNTLDLAGGVLAIDATSTLFADATAGVTGDVENAGLIDVGAYRFSIGGDYTSDNGSLSVVVSPGTISGGGLTIDGDVVGTTQVSFVGDGTEVPNTQGGASILVIASPNDNAATAGGFAAAGSSNGIVRVNGSFLPWTFGQQADHNWYLSTEATAILPEIGGYAILPSVGYAGILEDNRLLLQRMSGIRGDAPQCGVDREKTEHAYKWLKGDCHGFWTAVTGSELEMGANPGFAFSGDALGLYVGIDRMLQDRESRTLRGGLYAGFQRGNYWTTGANSTDLQAAGESNVVVDTPTFGMYSSVNWRGGSYVDLTLVAQLPKADILADGFREQITGNSLTLTARGGHRFVLGNGWDIEPQLQLSAIAMGWGDKIDSSGKRLVMDDDVLGMARAAVRAEKAFETNGGSRIRTWATVGVQDTVGEKESAVGTMAGSELIAFPNHQLGMTATLDVGVEAELNASVSLFGALSYGDSLDGTDSEQRQANLGIRIRW